MDELIEILADLVIEEINQTNDQYGRPTSH